jgi:hypothetical protein
MHLGGSSRRLEIGAVYAGLRGVDFCRPLQMATAGKGVSGKGMDKGDF